MFARSNSNERASPKKATPPSPSYMSSEQFAAYLKDLRASRLNRPGGARPLPASKRDTSSTATASPSPSSRPSFTAGPHLSETASFPVQNGTSEANNASSPTELSPDRNSMTASVGSKYSNVTRGRDYYPDRPARPLKPSEVVPSATYIERGQRWMEKEEAVSLRKAMEDMDLKEHNKSASGGPLVRPDVGAGSGSDEAPEQTEEERRLYEAALAEAAELVWQHENPGKERPPEPGTPYRYKPHLRKDSYAHARTASVKYGSVVPPTGLARDTSVYSMSGSSTDGEEGQGSSRSPVSSATSRPLPSRLPETPKASRERMRDGSPESGNSKSYSTLSGNSGGYLRSGSKKDIFGEPQKPFQGEKISEESEARSSSSSLDNFAQTRTPEQLGAKPKNPLARVQFAPETSSAADGVASSPPKDGSRYEKYEIHRNPVTQSRNPQYTTNVRPALPWERKKPAQEDVPRKHGMEIRSDEIRQATSMKLKDRSVKLPTPSAVSDNPGRPIVSFDRQWKAPDEAADDTPEGPSRFGKSDDRSTPLVPGRFRSQQSPQPQEEPQQPHHQQPQQTQQQRALPQQPQRPQQQKQQPQQQPGSTPNVPVISVSNGFSTSSSSSSPTRRPLPIPAAPSIQINAPPSPSFIPSISVPSIAVSEPASSSSSRSNIPQIVLPGGSDDDGPGIPVIVTPDDKPSTGGGNSSTNSSRRPLPTPGAAGRQIPARPRSHWSPAPKPAGSRATARCHECGDFIEGRFVSLAGMTERFHPQCFTCYSCGTSLEALEISPEPNDHRAARLERIARRAAGEHLPETPGQTMAEDGDARLRFYCHLDWHELFAPRCKHCTTPIMGEHVVALGHHWHFGHFFCAECGDPFERGMTHIEKDGYAWCVSCQTKRTERRAPKCKKCRKAVIGQYIRALGGEWHDECFRCADCSGGFDDGQIFPREGRAGTVPGEMVVLCTGCMERELKA